jgi:hypothetical protein
LYASGDTETAFRVVSEPCAGAAVDDTTPCALVVGGTRGADLDRGWLLRLEPATGAILQEATLEGIGVLGLVRDGADGALVVGGVSGDDSWQVQRLDGNFQPLWATPLGVRGLLRTVDIDREGYIHAGGRISAGGDDDGHLAILSPTGEVLEGFIFDAGGDERFNEVLIGPAGRVTAAGQSSGAGGGRFLLLNIDTGKQF